MRQALESDDDAEMLDIVFGNRIYDIYTMMPWGSSPTLGQIYGQVLTAGSNTTVSLLESKLQQIETDKHIKRIFQAQLTNRLKEILI